MLNVLPSRLLRAGRFCGTFLGRYCFCGDVGSQARKNFPQGISGRCIFSGMQDVVREERPESASLRLQFASKSLNGECPEKSISMGFLVPTVGRCVLGV